ncbi:MAG TPA: carboxypeptidase regulatory-like domain-containing protein, partial [Planctomycetota bacterium]|nr:carboxypeptidase regulatory-like domain-containing protein [Planctomycetota bacterium]
PGQALEVRLSRAAALEVLVLDGFSPLAGANVELTTDGYHLEQINDLWSSSSGEDPMWTAESDVSGIAKLAELPPRVPLQLAVEPRSGLRRIEGEPITLEAGERRRVEIRLGSGSTILGRVEDGERQPVVDLDVWRIAATWPVPARIYTLQEPAARTRTDSAGRFRFDDVPPGAWHVGPPFDEPFDDSAKTSDAIVGLAQHVKVEPGSDLHEVVIQVDRGLYLGGTVLDPDGRPAPTVSVSATATQVLDYSGGYTNEAGRFRIGPLCAGVYVMEADGAGQHAPSQGVTARAGDSDLVLHLRVGGTIRGRTSDAAGRPQRCEVLLAGEGEDHWVIRLSEGTFSFEGLSPGTYALAARSADGLCGRRVGLVLRAGQTLEGVDLVLAQGARLRIGFTGQDHCGYEIRVDGVSFFADGIERGTERTVAVPPGEIEVRWSDLDGSILKTQRLTLAQGEERSIGWDGKR